MRQFRHHHAFTQTWFKANLWWLRRLFNAPIVGRWLRRQMGLTLDGQVIDIRPDSIVIQFNENDYQYVGWTGDVISQFVYQTAKPLWWAIHYWDEWIADRWIPQLSYGFNALDNINGGNLTGPPMLRRFADSDLAAINSWDLAISCEANTYSNARNATSGSTLNVWRTQASPATPIALQVSMTRTNVAPTLQVPQPHVIYRTFLHFNTSPMAGDRGQFIPGRITVTWASVIVVPQPSGNISPGPIVLCQSTISPTKRSSDVVGSDYRQTPVSTFTNLATTSENGTRKPPRDANNQAIEIVPDQIPSNQPNCYQWILRSGGSSTLSEIEAYYYPPSFGTYGLHNGLARFCLRAEAEALNQSYTLSDRVNVIYSRETAESGSLTQNALLYYTPRLMVNYTRQTVVDVLSMKGTNQQGQPTDRVTQFGLATITGPTVIRPRTITSNVNPLIAQPLTRFGTPIILPGRELYPPSMPIFTRIGIPMIPFIAARGVNAAVTFGSARVISPIRPPSITNNADPFVGEALSRFGNTRIVRGIFVYPIEYKVTTDATETQPGNFGLPRIDDGDFEVKPQSVPRSTQFGARPAIGHAFPDEIYANQIQDLPLQYQSVSIEFDGGRVENNIQLCGVRQWRIVYEGLSEADVATLVTHFNKVQGRVGLFPFYHRRDQVTYENCRYAGFDMPSRLKKWSNAVTITIEREE